MKIKKIRQLIRAEIKGANSNFSDLAVITNEAQKNLQNALNFGRKTDEDAILMFIKVDNAIRVALFAGRSILLGIGIREYLFDYHNGVSEHTEHCIEWLVDNATDVLKKESEFFAVLRDNESDRWRGFRGDKPMNLDEIKAKATMALH